MIISTLDLNNALIYSEVCLVSVVAELKEYSIFFLISLKNEDGRYDTITKFML